MSSYKKHFVLFLLILLIGCLMQTGTDVYTPSLVAIAHAFSAPINLAQLTMPIYVLGVSISAFIYGPLSEGIGRRTPLMVGLCIMLAGCLIALFAQSIYMLLIGRLIQGLGVGAAATLWRAIFRDSFHGEELAKYSSYFSILVMFVLPAMPVLGGYLQHYFNWQASFAFLTIYTCVTLILVKLLYRETSQQHHTDRLQFKYIFRTFNRLFTSRIFMGLSVCVFLTYGTLFSWFTVGPILLIHHVGISPVEFGWLSLLGGVVGFGLASYINGKVVKHFGMPTMLRFGWIVNIVGAIALVISKFIFGVHLWAIVVPVLIIYFGSTFIWPNAFSLCFSPFGDIAGYASTLYTVLQLGGGAVIGAIAAHLSAATQVPFAYVVGITSLASIILFQIVVAPAVRRLHS